jgi:hypothetical protein
MGASASIISPHSEPKIEIKTIPLKKLPEAIEESIFIHEKVKKTFSFSFFFFT